MKSIYYIYKNHSQWVVNPFVQGADVGILGQDMEQRGQDPVVSRAGHQVQQQGGVGVLVPGTKGYFHGRIMMISWDL